ncbi:MAG: heavy-metal-associated domain-containing protein [Limnochordia bacterium]|jgi:copper chaperone CopZ
MKRQMMMLDNLSCPACAAKLEKALQRLPGMISAKVSFGAGSLNVEYDETQLQEADIKARIKQFGADVLG